MADLIPMKGTLIVYKEGDKKKILVQLQSGSIYKLDEKALDVIPEIRNARPAPYRSCALRELMTNNED